MKIIVRILPVFPGYASLTIWRNDQIWKRDFSARKGITLLERVLAPNTTVMNYWYKFLKIVIYQRIYYAKLWEELHLSGLLLSMMCGIQQALNNVNTWSNGCMRVYRTFEARVGCSRQGNTRCDFTRNTYPSRSRLSDQWKRLVSLEIHTNM